MNAHNHRSRSVHEGWDQRMCNYQYTKFQHYNRVYNRETKQSSWIGSFLIMLFLGLAVSVGFVSITRPIAPSLLNQLEREAR